MGWQIIKQGESDVLIDGEKVIPGRYCVRSSVVDALIAFNCDKAEVIALFVEAAMKDSIRGVLKKIELIDAGKLAYHLFTRSWDSVLEEHKAKEEEA